MRPALLAVPTTDWRLDLTNLKPSDLPYKSFEEKALAPWLNWSRMVFFSKLTSPQNEEQKAETEKRPQLLARPIKGNLRGVCNTFIATAEYDPVRGEGEEYARRLAQVGAKVISRLYTGVPHPFMYMLPIKKAMLYLDDTCAELKRAHYA